MNLFLIGMLMFVCGFIGLGLTAFLAYYFPANMVRTAMTTGAVSVGSLATKVPGKKRVFSYVFKQLFYWKSWAGRFDHVRVLASQTKTSVKEIGFWRTTGKGGRYLVVAGWNVLRSFIKALLLPFAIAAAISASIMVLGGFMMMIAVGIWVFA